MKATTTIPIVITSVDPVGSGLCRLGLSETQNTRRPASKEAREQTRLIGG
jgi:ABC-type uncharacterized transport system substrate-binding protein